VVLAQGSRTLELAAMVWGAGRGRGRGGGQARVGVKMEVVWDGALGLRDRTQVGAVGEAALDGEGGNIFGAGLGEHRTDGQWGLFVVLVVVVVMAMVLFARVAATTALAGCASRRCCGGRAF